MDSTESIDDIVGPGVAREIKVKPEAKEAGARISKNSKKIITAIIGGLAVAMIIGIITAGNKPKESSVTSADVAAVGRTPPPTPPAKFNLMNTSAASPENEVPASGVAESQSLLGNKGLLSNQRPENRPGLQGGQHELSPKEKHRKWIEEQHYKRLEGSILAADAAHESGFGDAANASLTTQHLQAQAANNNALTTGLDALRAAASGGSSSGIDPSLLAKLNAAGGQAGAPDPQSQHKAFSRGVAACQHQRANRRAIPA